MKRFMVFWLILICTTAFGQNARGILRLKGESKELKAGESYQFQFTLLPFSKTALTPKLLEGKRLINFFYISKVDSIEQSANNYEAVIVDLQAILTKPFKPQELYIWSLGDRNIPVELQNFTVNSDPDSAKVAGKEFTIFQSGTAFKMSEKHWLAFIVLIAVLLGVWAWYFLIYKKRKISQNGNDHLIKALKKAKEHQDFEKIYFNKSLYLMLYKENDARRRRFLDLLDLYRIDQFSTSWKDRDISDLISAKNNIFKGETSGS